MSVFEQIVETFLALFLGISYARDTACCFHGVALAEKIAEIGFFFVNDIGLERLPALESSGRVKVATPPATAHIGQTTGAGIGTHHATGNTGRFAATPTKQSFQAI